MKKSHWPREGRDGCCWGPWAGKIAMWKAGGYWQHHQQASCVDPTLGWRKSFNSGSSTGGRLQVLRSRVVGPTPIIFVLRKTEVLYLRCGSENSLAESDQVFCFLQWLLDILGRPTNRHIGLIAFPCYVPGPIWCSVMQLAS